MEKRFVILSYEEVMEIQEELENYADLRILREAKALMSKILRETT